MPVVSVPRGAHRGGEIGRTVRERYGYAASNIYYALQYKKVTEANWNAN